MRVEARVELPHHEAAQDQPLPARRVAGDPPGGEQLLGDRVELGPWHAPDRGGDLLHGLRGVVGEPAVRRHRDLLERRR
ncbi:hypothetical protein [Nonomuraea sp. NPDC003804]|uniref:hypothetical protein n=1 Tax=Nonomuraea sp. NPDC003804 TaxID=3154547 RepID=UPI0033BAADC6